MLTSWKIFGTEAFLHYCEFLTDSSTPKVVFNKQTNSKVHAACQSVQSEQVEVECRLRKTIFTIQDWGAENKMLGCQ